MLSARIHSVETCATTDGPGLRYVVFFQGCALRCQYCHNPDTWPLTGGHEASIDELVRDILRYRPYFDRSGGGATASGGVTASGGEPLLQHALVRALFETLRAQGVHTALDTAGQAPSAAYEVLNYTQLALLDIKAFDPTLHERLTGHALAPTLRFLDELGARGVETWVRYVLVPGLTDDMAQIEALGRYLAGMLHVKRTQVLPYHRLGEHKWRALGLDYPLEGVAPPDDALIKRAQTLLDAR